MIGSRARGDELADSDYDLLLVSAAFASLPWRDRIAAVLELWDLEVDLHPLCYTPEEYTRKLAEISTVSEAVRDGVLLTTG